MQTQRQLQKGDVVLSGATDVPGFFFVVPRVSGQATVGFGAGDASVHAGTALGLVNGGLTGRVYLGPKWIAKLETDASVSYITDGLADPFVLLYGMAQVSRAVTKKHGIYGGALISTGGLIGIGDDRVEWAGINAGGVIGIDILLNKFKNFGLQIEARLAPIAINPAGRIGVLPFVSSGGTQADNFGSNGVFMGQLGFGIYKRLPSKADRPAASQWGEEEPPPTLAPQARFR